MYDIQLVQGVPVVMTTVWAAVTAVQHTGTECWWGYNLSPYFWILEGPRLTVIIVRGTITKCVANLYTQRLLPKRSKRSCINGNIASEAVGAEEPLTTFREEITIEHSEEPDVITTTV
ncbi:PDF receptor-like 2 [Homarus americanus]|uniref:PDF receptor-like 2 n=1 Tax=Homarus americanus TaxID=6706 RepID=A0A8J5MKD9_HOMAM|nr:PDF receptor-like 2 [Homarus americanus]